MVECFLSFRRRRLPGHDRWSSGRTVRIPVRLGKDVRLADPAARVSGDTRRMRIRLETSAFAAELVASLLRGHCVPVLVDETTVDVIHPHAVDSREAAVEILFFLRAWEIKNGIQAAIIPRS